MLRQAGTERPFGGEYTDTKTQGVYSCRACGAELFRSDAQVRVALRVAVVLHPAGRGRGDRAGGQHRWACAGWRWSARTATATSATCSPARATTPRRTCGTASTRYLDAAGAEAEQPVDQLDGAGQRTGARARLVDRRRGVGSDEPGWRGHVEGVGLVERLCRGPTPLARACSDSGVLPRLGRLALEEPGTALPPSTRPGPPPARHTADSASDEAEWRDHRRRLGMRAARIRRGSRRSSKPLGRADLTGIRTTWSISRRSAWRSSRALAAEYPAAVLPHDLLRSAEDCAP